MKILLDTNVWIAFLRNPVQWAGFESRMNRPLLLMSSVVALELLAGCRTPSRERALVNLLKPFEKADRVVTPDHLCFRKAGHVLASLANDGIGPVHRRQLLNDILIAVSAARAGAVVITNNVSDFSRIQTHTPVRWMLPSLHLS